MLQELIRFLPIAEKIVPRNSTIEVLRNIAFIDGHIVATDLDIIARMPVPETRSFLIPFGILKTVLKSKPISIDVDLTEQHRTKITYDNKAVSFPRGEVADFPNMPNGKFKLIGTWSKDAVMLLHSQLPYTSTDELRPALNCIYVNQNGAFASCATDGHVLRLIKEMDPHHECKLKKFSGIVPKRILQLLPRLVKNSVQVSYSEDWFRFELEHGLTLDIRAVEGTYPDFARVIPQEFASSVQVDVERMRNLAEAAKAFANRATMASEFDIDQDNILIKVENTEENTHWESSMKVERLSGNGVRVGMNLGYLEKVLDGVSGKKALWKYNDAASASVFSDPESNGGSAMNLIMPIRLAKEGDSDG